MSAQDTIKQTVTSHPVVLYMKGSPQFPMCGFSATATIPQLYVKGEFVGGCDIMREMYQSGELQKLIAEAKK